MREGEPHKIAKLFARGEWRYAMALMLLLLLAAVASLSTISYLQKLIHSLEYDTTATGLIDYQAYEQTLLAAKAGRTAQKIADAGAQDSAAFISVLSDAHLEEDDLIGAVVLSRDSIPIAHLFVQRRPVSYEGLPPDFVDWPAIVESLDDKMDRWVAYAISAYGPMLIAIARIDEGSEDEHGRLLAVVQPIDNVYLTNLRAMYPACSGWQPIGQLDDPGQMKYVHVEDFRGRTIGAFIVHPDLTRADAAVQTISLTLVALTMGFLFLAGALGLWAMRVIAVMEGRRRIGEFVDAMDYLSDGLVAMDRRGRITGANPASLELAASGRNHRSEVRDLFPSITSDDLGSLLDTTTPHEVERVSVDGAKVKTLRFRSQPLEDINLILISDVTSEKMREMRHRQITQLQLIGRIARGVAHDFNNILCAISGHADIMDLTKDQGVDAESLAAIKTESDRGALLARQLLDLSRSGVKDIPCDDVAPPIEQAVELLRVALPSRWQVDTSVSGSFGTVPLTGVQLEQVVLNLGLVAADEYPAAGRLRVQAHRPGSQPPFDVDARYGVVITIFAVDGEVDSSAVSFEIDTRKTDELSGVIQSVVRSILEEVGGRLDRLRMANGYRAYRACLPSIDPGASITADDAPIREEIQSYMKSWRVLVASHPNDTRKKIVRHLDRIGSSVDTADDLVTCLAQVQSDDDYDGIVLEMQLLGEEADGLIRAILKLKPDASIVVLQESPGVAPDDLKEEVVFEINSAAPEAITNALLRGRELAGTRSS